MREEFSLLKGIFSLLGLKVASLCLWGGFFLFRVEGFLVCEEYFSSLWRNFSLLLLTADFAFFVGNIFLAGGEIFLVRVEGCLACGYYVPCWRGSFACES